MHTPETCAKLDCANTAGPYHTTAPGFSCMVPDTLRGVRMNHSDDLVAVFHGYAEPALACGFHATYYAQEVYAAHRELMGATR